MIFKHISSDILSIVSLCTRTPFVGLEGHLIDKFHEQLPKAELDEYPGEEFTETLMIVDPRQNSLGLRMYTPTKFLNEELKIEFTNEFEKDLIFNQTIKAINEISKSNSMESSSNSSRSINNSINGENDLKTKIQDQADQKQSILSESIINSKLGKSPLMYITNNLLQILKIKTAKKLIIH